MRQQTLVRTLLLASGAHTPTRAFSSTQGKFFPMPPGAKPAPPQQASLSEFWNKGKAKASTKLPKVQDDAPMQVDSDREPYAPFDASN